MQDSQQASIHTVKSIKSRVYSANVGKSVYECYLSGKQHTFTVDMYNITDTIRESTYRVVDHASEIKSRTIEVAYQGICHGKILSEYLSEMAKNLKRVDLKNHVTVKYIFVDENHKVLSLFEPRTDKMGVMKPFDKHEVALPGGTREATDDESIYATGVREVLEELPEVFKNMKYTQEFAFQINTSVMNIYNKNYYEIRNQGLRTLKENDHCEYINIVHGCHIERNREKVIIYCTVDSKTLTDEMLGGVITDETKQKEVHAYAWVPMEDYIDAIRRGTVITARKHGRPIYGGIVDPLDTTIRSKPTKCKDGSIVYREVFEKPVSTLIDTLLTPLAYMCPLDETPEVYDIPKPLLDKIRKYEESNGKKYIYKVSNDQNYKYRQARVSAYQNINPIEEYFGASRKLVKNKCNRRIRSVNQA